ncbi:MAG: hypothetical protein WCD81_06920 [Candidatus Bathyarchaeia archaeon]
MSDERKYLKVHVMDNGVWDVEIPPNVWKEVSEWCEKDSKGYSIQEEYQGTMRYRIWAKTLGHLIDLLQKTSEILKKTPS